MAGVRGVRQRGVLLHRRRAARRLPWLLPRLRRQGIWNLSCHLLIQSCDEDQDKIVTLRNPVLTWPRDTRSNCKIAGRLEWHGGRGNHDADAHLALGHLQNRLEQGGKVTFSIYIAVVPISINLRLASDSDLVTLADKLELKSLLQVEKAKARLDKWEDKKQPLLEG
jgi:hypothetical protein